MTDSYTLLAAQREMINQLGDPEAFSISFFEEELEDGSRRDVRSEV